MNGSSKPEPRLLRDIRSQVDSLHEVLRLHTGPGLCDLQRAAESIAGARRVLITGMGASMYAATTLEYALSALGIEAITVESSELLYYRSNLCRNAVMVTISRSGESVEVAKLLSSASDVECSIAVTNDPASALARAAGVSISIGSLPDEMVAIQSYTGTVLCLHLLASAVAGALEAAAREAADALPTLQQFISEGEKRLASWNGFFRLDAPVYVLGRGPSVASSLEGALLFHETAKFPAVAMPVASFRHGPVEVVDERFTGIVFASSAATRELDLALARDVARFGGRVCVVGQADNQEPFDAWRLPDVPASLHQIFEIIPVQLAALRLAQLRGLVVGSFRYTPQVTRDEASFASNGSGSEAARAR